MLNFQQTEAKWIIILKYSKGGTTEAALRVMAEHKVKEGIMAGALAANERSAQLGELLGQD